MSSSRGFTLIEAVVAVLIGALLVVAMGGLSERLVHHRVTTDSNSAAMSLAERQMEALLADPIPNPTGAQCPAANLCGDTPANGGRTHGPTSVNENLVASGSGPYNVQWVVIDANNTSPTTSPLALAAGSTSLVKKITVSVSHLRNPQVSATVVRYYKVS
jgi:prepilin-type N-terminal cleavage/methylation domain-containing protein